MYKITFIVPTTHIEAVKTAMFNAGAGELGHYKHCAWQVLGEGQFIASEEADPFIGNKNQVTKVAEYLVQVICRPEIIREVIAAMKQTHPYEEPAYDVVKIEAF